MHGVRERVLLRHLLEQDVSLSAAARQLGVHRSTVHRWIDAGLLDTDTDRIQARYTPRPQVPTKLDPFKPLLAERLRDFPELTAVRLFAETIDRAGDDEATRNKCTALLVTESERLSKLIERLLDWGRMEAGRKIYELRHERVEDIIDDVVKAYAPQRDIADVDFSVEVADGVPDVMVDRGAIVDAVVNLLSNAQKYGGSKPVVRLVATAGDKGEVRIAVKDNGEGIPMPEHRRIFEKFYRIDDRLSRTKEGSGLGLAIVNHIARAHRARVVVDSAPGKGSTFTIVLPSGHEG